MPRFTWKEEDMAKSLAFFPFVGVVIGAVVWLINAPLFMAQIPVAIRVILTILAPIVITGGFHLDGFMDTEDALRSYADRDKKLEILKDPHIGAFAVIGLVRTLLIFAAAVCAVLLSGEGELRTILIFAAIFPIGRCLSGLTSLVFKKAKKDGMLYEETRNMQKGMIAWLIVLTAVLGGLVIYLNPLRGLVVILSFGLYTLYYRHRSYKEFGGVTGDTAGYFLTVSETLAAAVLGLSIYIF